MESFVVWCKREEGTHIHIHTGARGTGRLPAVLDCGPQGNYVEEAAFELGHGGQIGLMLTHAHSCPL